MLAWPFSPCLHRVRRLEVNNLGPEGGMALAEALKSNSTLKELGSAALPSNPPTHALRSFTALHASVCVTPFPLPLEASQHPPCPPSNATSHSLRVPRMSPARAQPTHRLHIHTARRWLAVTPAPNPTLPPSPTPPRVGSVACACVFAPSRLHLPVTGWRATTSATTPSRPSERPPVAASIWTSSERPWCLLADQRNLWHNRLFTGYALW